MQAFKVLHLSSVDCDFHRGGIVFNLEIAMAIRRRMIFVFFAFKYKPLLSLCVLTDCSNLRSPSGFCANSTVSSAYLSSFTSFPCIFTALKLVGSPSASTLRMIVSVYMLNMGGDSMQPCRTPRLTGNQSVKPLSSLTAGNCSLYRLIIKFVIL